MELIRFSELAAAYGAERGRWPPASHALFDRLAGTPEGARVLAQAAELDVFLDALEVREEDPLRPVRIVRAATSVVRRRHLLAWLATAYAASALLGFAFGFTQLADAEEQISWSDTLRGSNVIEEYL
jgi:hypothetical protein